MHAWTPFFLISSVAIVAAVVIVRATHVRRTATALGVAVAATGGIYALRGHLDLALVPLAPYAALIALTCAGVGRRSPPGPEVSARSRHPEIGAALAVGGFAAVALAAVWRIVTPIPADGGASPRPVLATQADLTLVVALLAIAAAGAMTRASGLTAAASLAVAASTAPLAVVALGHARSSVQTGEVAVATLLVALAIVAGALVSLEAARRCGAGTDLDELASSRRPPRGAPPRDTLTWALDEASDALDRWADGGTRTQVASFVAAATFLVVVVALC